MTSHVDTAFGELCIHPMPSGKVVSVSKAVTINGKVLFLGADGRIYCPSVKDKSYFSRGCNWRFLGIVLGGLVKLKAITADQVRLHKEFVAAHEARNEAGYALQDLKKLEAKYGIRVSKRERAKIERLAKAGAA